MIFHKEVYARWAQSRFYPLFLGLLAFLFMCSSVLPFEVILVPAVAAAPRRWRSIAFTGMVGSALGAVLLSVTFRYLGWPLVDRLFPALGGSAGWARAVDWIGRYGGYALIPLAASPMAQTPVLVLAGLLQVSPLHVLCAFILGKSLKYGLEAWGTVRLEQRIRRPVGR